MSPVCLHVHTGTQHRYCIHVCDTSTQHRYARVNIVLRVTARSAPQNRYGTADSQQKEISTIRMPGMTTRSAAWRTGRQRSRAPRLFSHRGLTTRPGRRYDQYSAKFYTTVCCCVRLLPLLTLSACFSSSIRLPASLSLSTPVSACVCLCVCVYVRTTSGSVTALSASRSRSILCLILHDIV